MKPSPAAPPAGGLTTAPLYWFGLVLLLVPLTGPLRHLIGLDMTKSLLAAILLCTALACFWQPRRDQHPVFPALWLSGGLCFAFSASVTLILFYNSRCFGLPTTGAIDALGHLMELQLVVAEKRQVYWDMTIFHHVTYWLQRFSQLDSARAFRLVLYGQLLGVVTFFALAQAIFAVGLTRRSPGQRTPIGRAIWLACGLSLLLGIYPALGFLFPILHGFQLDGFFPHLQGLLPLFALVLLYATGNRRLHRLLGLCLGIILLRYTYYLNIIEVLATCSLVVAWEVWTTEQCKTRRRIFLALSVMSLGLCGYLYTVLSANRTSGGIPPSELSWKITGTALLALLLLAAPELLRRLCKERTTPLQRLCTFVGIYGLCAVIVQGAWLLSVKEPEYLLYKYGFSAAVLVLLCSIPCAGHLVARALCGHAGRGIRGWLLAGGTLAIAGFGASALSYSVPQHYRESFQWRVTDAPSPLSPLADLAAWKMIRRVLKQSGGQLGAFFTPILVETHFAGYELRQPDVDADPPYLVPDGLLAGLPPILDYPLLEILQPGHCIFWLDPALFADIDPARREDNLRAAAVRRLHRGPRACTPYHRPSLGDDTVKLCYTCFEGTTRAVPLAGSSQVSLSGFGPLQEHGRKARGTGSIRLRWKLTGRCSLTLRAAQAQVKVTLNDQPLLEVIPGRFAIPAKLTAGREEQTFTLKHPDSPEGANAGEVWVHRLSITCVKPEVPTRSRTALSLPSRKGN